MLGVAPQPGPGVAAQRSQLETLAAGLGHDALHQPVGRARATQRHRRFDVADGDDIAITPVDREDGLNPSSAIESLEITINPRLVNYLWM